QHRAAMTKRAFRVVARPMRREFRLRNSRLGRNRKVAFGVAGAASTLSVTTPSPSATFGFSDETAGGATATEAFGRLGRFIQFNQSAEVASARDGKGAGLRHTSEPCSSDELTWRSQHTTTPTVS